MWTNHTSELLFRSLKTYNLGMNEDVKRYNDTQAPELKPVWISTSNCGIARFDLRSDGFVRVLGINDTRHLIDL